jgi:hypothetical protein
MSILKVDTLQTTSGVGLYPARAWVNFNGSGTVTIRANGNVSSITDVGVGDYTVNLTTAMPDANYAAATGGQNDQLNNGFIVVESISAGSMDLRSRREAAFSDGPIVCVTVLR